MRTNIMGIHNHFRPAKEQINTAEKRTNSRDTSGPMTSQSTGAAERKHVLKRGRVKRGREEKKGNLIGSER
jgi:hypothetical protein